VVEGVRLVDQLPAAAVAATPEAVPRTDTKITLEMKKAGCVPAFSYARNTSVELG
jgi:hypothetical protein